MPWPRGRRRHTPTDRELLDCLARGWTKREIAEEFRHTYVYIDFRQQDLRNRMGARTNEHMMALYLAAGPKALTAEGYWAGLATSTASV